VPYRCGGCGHVESSAADLARRSEPGRLFTRSGGALLGCGTAEQATVPALLKKRRARPAKMQPASTNEGARNQRGHTTNALHTPPSTARPAEAIDCYDWGGSPCWAGSEVGQGESAASELGRAATQMLLGTAESGKARDLAVANTGSVDERRKLALGAMTGSRRRAPCEGSIASRCSIRLQLQLKMYGFLFVPQDDAADIPDEFSD
jgi:hypothetical protein